MKINFLRNNPEALSGYLNVDPLATNEDSRLVFDYGNIDELCDNAEATQILARDILDFVDPAKIESIIRYWITKLRKGGQIVIGGVDLEEVAQQITNCTLNLVEANKLLRGDSSNPFSVRRSTMTMETMVNILEHMGLKVLHKRIHNFHFSVTAERE